MISENITRSRHDEIQKKQKMRNLHVSPPKEYLSRHPRKMKSFINACRVGREESRKTLPALEKYLRLTPSSLDKTTEERVADTIADETNDEPTFPDQPQVPEDQNSMNISK